MEQSELLSKLSVSLINSAGQLKSLTELIKEIGEKYDSKLTLQDLEDLGFQVTITDMIIGENKEENKSE